MTPLSCALTVADNPDERFALARVACLTEPTNAWLHLAHRDDGTQYVSADTDFEQRQSAAAIQAFRAWIFTGLREPSRSDERTASR